MSPGDLLESEHEESERGVYGRHPVRCAYCEAPATTGGETTGVYACDAHVLDACELLDQLGSMTGRWRVRLLERHPDALRGLPLW